MLILVRLNLTMYSYHVFLATSKSRKSSDIMRLLFSEKVAPLGAVCFSSLLVNIYGSKELFIVEYQSLLADRVLSSLDYNTEKEVNEDSERRLSIN